MSARTQQDNDISLYSLGELQAMRNRYEGNNPIYIPFTSDEINQELEKRKVADLSAFINYEPTFIKEWNTEQFKGMEKAIPKHFSGKEMFTHHGNLQARQWNWGSISDLLGLAYTSSSSCAGYWICNTDVESNDYKGFRYVGFAISEKGRYYAILWDKDENEKLILL